MTRRLTEEADAERAEFNSRFDGVSCTCFQNPPCGKCTHPGNPVNQEEDDDCWIEDEEGDDSEGGVA